MNIKRKIVFIIIIVLLTITGYSQQNYQITKENADCETPVLLEDTIFGPTNAPEGYGKLMEITAEKNNIYYFEKEYNTVWYKFKVPMNCFLTFKIVPVEVKDDYDFILFRYTDNNFCRDIKSKKIKPVRTNLSRNDPKISSITGLSDEASVEYEHSGPGAQFSKGLDVKKDEIYYLVVDNVYENGSGHKVNLHYDNCTEQPEKNTSVLNLSIVDKATYKPLKATINIFRSNSDWEKKPDFSLADTNECSLYIDNRQSYSLQISAKGYLNYSQEITFSKDQQELTLKLELEKIEAGKNFKIDNIYFVGDLAKFITTSAPALKHLLKFMKDNPEVKIEIQGHVNNPASNGKSSKEDLKKMMKLSEDRAQAVYEYLIKNHIDPSRMTYAGFGGLQMLFPNAVNPKQEQKNRRVEIKITSN